jgi:nicotinate-nucleotide adenylyltransferase
MVERRVAAFGGTFDPIHNGHLEVARTVVRQFRLDRLLLIPAYRPPHKRTRRLADGYHRFAMAVLASLDEPKVLVSTIELESPEKPYAFQTIERLKSNLGPDTRLFFVVGADSFEEINTWREPERLLSSTNWIVVARPGHTLDSSHLDSRFRSRIIALHDNESAVKQSDSSDEYHIYLTSCVSENVSSTRIRQMVRDGESIDGLVPPRVAEYIGKYELYKG